VYDIFYQILICSMVAADYNLSTSLNPHIFICLMVSIDYSLSPSLNSYV